MARKDAPREPRELTHFEKHIAEGSVFIAAALAESFLCCYGVVRAAHIQRSAFYCETEAAWLFYCAAGKAREGKARVPFYCALPKVSISGTAVPLKLFAALRTEPDEDPRPYLLRAWGPELADPGSATFWVNRPLSQAAAKRARQELLQLPPLSLTAAQATQCTSYRARRVLPTGPGCCTCSQKRQQPCQTGVTPTTVKPKQPQALWLRAMMRPPLDKDGPRNGW